MGIDKKIEMAKEIKLQPNTDEVPVDGSLGLLAVGYRGVMAWRDARQKAGINIVEIRKKEDEERKAEMEKKKAEFEKKKAELKAEREKEDKNKKDK